MVEVWPYAERSRGIAVFQLFGRLAGFFTTFVNPIGLEDVGWKYLISYCCWLAFEVAFVYFMFPETFGRTLEELAFSKTSSCLRRDANTREPSLTIAQCLRTRVSQTRRSRLRRKQLLTTMRTHRARLQ